MEREVTFKRGVDLASESGTVPPEIVSCESCGDQIESASAARTGWQVRPPVCPHCLRWSATQSHAIAEEEVRFQIEKRGRFWAVLDGETLVCLTVYKKGAASVVGRLAEREGRHGGN